MNRRIDMMQGKGRGRPLTVRKGVASAIVALLLLIMAGVLPSQLALAQEPQPPFEFADPSDPSARMPLSPPAGVDPQAMAEAALAAEELTDSNDDAATGTPAPDAPKIEILELLVQGGALMWPIFVMSLLVVTFGVERLLGLRTRRVLPQGLVRKIREMLVSPEQSISLDKIQRCCEYYPSAAANVIHSILRRSDRPAAEIEHAVGEACDREAASLYANVRWLSLAAGVTPLLGLLGTVWGMIQAFFATANLPVGANKADYLAEGIYVALVTTFAGLAVAIPASVLAHIFEGRIQRLFRDLDELLEDLIPFLERTPVAPPAAGIAPSPSATMGQGGRTGQGGRSAGSGIAPPPVYGERAPDPPYLSPAPPNRTN